MGYNTNWVTLDKDNKIVNKETGRACFAPLCHKMAFARDEQFLEYDFYNTDESLSEKELYKYFLFLKSIPEFAPLLPHDPMEMATIKKARFDLDKINGLQLFAMLTLIRSVVEDPRIVKEILAFDPNKEYSWTKLGILKAHGAVHCLNNGHWITKSIHVENVNYTPFKQAKWKSNKMAKETGLIASLHDTFSNYVGACLDGYMCANPVQGHHIKTVLDEHMPKKVVTKKKADNALQLDF